jgi:hypothetical protein
MIEPVGESATRRPEARHQDLAVPESGRPGYFRICLVAEMKARHSEVTSDGGDELQSVAISVSASIQTRALRQLCEIRCEGIEVNESSTTDA